MTNENKNINELVSEDDDPTAELEIISFREFDLSDVEPESESNTYGLNKDSGDASSPGQSIPELRSDLEKRTQTIGRLQYDIEQLRAKWLGLETEIKAREEIVNNLLQDVDSLKSKVSRKDNLLKKRNQTIKSLKADVEQREEIHRSLEKQHAELEQELVAQRSADADKASALEEAKREFEEIHTKLETARDEVASLSSEIVERDETNKLLGQQQADIEKQLAEDAAAFAETERELEQTRSKLETAEQRIESLKSDSGQRGEAHELLEQLHAELEQQFAATTAKLEEKENELQKMHSMLQAAQEQSADEIALTRQTSSAAIEGAKAQLSKAEEYADTLRYKLQEFTESQSRWSKERDSLNDAVEQLSERNWSLSEQLESAAASIIELQAASKQQHEDHQQEIGALRIELGDAQDTETATAELNAQLTSDLIDTRNFKEELERMLRKNDEAAQKRIGELEEELSDLTQTAEDLEQNVETKSNTIAVLLNELAKKSEQIDSIGEIENVIQEIDNRMSERFDEQEREESVSSDMAQKSSDRDRVTRLLIGNIDNQELRFPLFKSRLTVGRHEDNDIQLRTTYVSRRHAVVLTENDTTRVIDWGSKNGIFVNSERVKEHCLSNGDIVAIGDVKFRYEERPKRDA